METKLNPGDKAPDFIVTDHKGNKLSPDSLRGKKTVIYFYPKDNTPGCTAEACSLRDGYEELSEKGFVVIGVSPDSDKSHISFSAKHNLPFHLVADTGKNLLKSYGAWGEKKMFGKVVQGVKRTTFVIDENGIIEHVIEKVDTKNHAGQILDLYK